jgi:3-oxoacyl-[acyl-carrier protein] reductase
MPLSSHLFAGYGEGMDKPNILVTGASRGIGSSIVAALSESGCNVAGHSTHGGGNLIGADLSEESAAADLWHTALERLDDRIDVIINNAGIFDANPLDRDAKDWANSWNATIQINLTSAALLSRLAVLHWQQNQCGGRIVNIASRAAHRGDSPAHWHYAASKAGMVAMTKTIARAYAAQEIYAFAVCPGFTMTGMAEDYLASRGGDKLLADIPLGKVATPEEIAAVAKFCALDAPPSMTGAVLDVNGASYVR